MSLEQKIEELIEVTKKSTEAYKQCITAMGKFAKLFESATNKGAESEVNTTEQEEKPSAAEKKKEAAAAKRKEAAAKKKAEAAKKKKAEEESESDDDDLDFLGDDSGDDEKEEPEATKEEVVSALQKFAKADKNNPPKAKKLLEKFGAANISQLDKDDYRNVLDALKKVGF
jgi:membrane protein involved in colicin uptake